MSSWEWKWDSIRQRPRLSGNGWTTIQLSASAFPATSIVTATSTSTCSAVADKVSTCWLAIGADRVITAYFEALIEAVALINCDVLCHLDAVLRHLPGIRFNGEHERQIEQLLDGMEAKGVAMEINTSGFDYRGAAFPAPWIITEALKRGITLCAGSDAHLPSEVGRHFEQLPDYLAAIQS